MKVKIYDNLENVYTEVEAVKVDDEDLFYFTVYTKNGSVTYDRIRYEYEIL